MTIDGTRLVGLIYMTTLLGLVAWDDGRGVDPSVYDCTARSAPERSSSTPLDCVTNPSCTVRLVSGHRGSGGALGVLAPEGTVVSVNAAIALGLDFIETDPHPTIDGVLINMHDPTVDRTTDGKGWIMLMTLSEIKALHVNSEKYPGDFSCVRVATLEEILNAARGKVHVIIDANKTDRVDLLVEAIKKTNTLEWVIFDTNSVDKIDAALALEPNLHTMVRVANLDELYVVMMHFAAHPPIIVEITDKFHTAALIKAVHEKNNRAFTYTPTTDLAAGILNSPSIYGPIFDKGLDIIQSDRPDLVLRYLGRFPKIYKAFTYQDTQGHAADEGQED